MRRAWARKLHSRNSKKKCLQKFKKYSYKLEYFEKYIEGMFEVLLLEA